MLNSHFSINSCTVVSFTWKCNVWAHRRAAVPTLTAAKFIELETERLALPSQLHSSVGTPQLPNEWKDWLKKRADGPHRASVAGAPLHQVMYWPSIAAVEAVYPTSTRHTKVWKDFMHHRVPFELTRAQRDAPMISFPSCKFVLAIKFRTSKICVA